MSDKSNVSQELFSYGDLPVDFREQLVREVGQYCVGLFGTSKRSEGEGLDYCGCGTLVSVANFGYILTAAHVWEKAEKFSSTGITLRENVDERFPIERQNIVAEVVCCPQVQDGWSEWGPDLCFLKIPTSDVTTISAFKSFYNLTKRREIVLSTSVDSGAGCWLLMGAPAVAGSFTEKHASLEYQGLFTDIQATCAKSGFDYLDVGGSVALANSRGMSGGSLWQVMLDRSKATLQFSIKEINLEGTAFFELADANIRCHGRQSIYRNLPVPPTLKT